MILWTKEELIEALSGEVLEHKITDNLTIDEVVIDSRKTPKSGLFIALKGENNDAHDFLEQSANNGCKLLLVHNKSALEKAKNCDFILVKNTFEALYKLAAFSRKRSLAKIIAITGSVGKTTTKEMLKLAFSTYGKTFATYGNLNNHIGLPLSLCNFSKECDFGIFEMGMNHFNEIKPLSKLARPHLAIITNVGPVHIEFFKNEEEIALAKSEIFAGLNEDGIALINYDNLHFKFIKKQAEIAGLKTENILSFGRNPESNYCLKKSEIIDINNSEVSISTKNKTKISYKISVSSKIMIFNSLIIAAALDLLTNDLNLGLAELSKIENIAGRGKAFDISFDQKTITIIDDSYNASLPSMLAGFEYATELKNALGKNRVIAAIGDMLELGEKSVELHNEIAKYLNELKIDFVVAVGQRMTEMTKNLSNPYKVFSDSTSASLEIQNLLQDGDILYVKGSRGTKMEKIIEKLTNKTSAH